MIVSATGARRPHALAVLLLFALLAVALCASPASAGFTDPGGESTGDGYVATAPISISGQVPGGTTVAASAPALCWWEPIALTTESVEAIAGFFAIFGIGADLAALQQVYADQEATGEQFGWYVRRHRDGATDEQLAAAGCNGFSGPYEGLFIGSLIRPFPPGNPPVPLPAPEEMAAVALEYLDLQPAALDWNPRAAQIGGATLVNLPTWLWVTNADAAVGDAQGERSVTATAGAGGQTVSVTVTAVAGALQIASPGGAVSCSPAQARTAWAPTVAENTACVLTFDRASVRYPAGFPVRATVAWSASWTGSGPGVPAGAQPLDGVSLTSTTEIPVREAQTLVQRVG
ncbi:hypothetical protein HMPREF0063_12289 [Aeromicrobium marinum DSM 15272]|uniref:Tat pathway signal sequence domain protein n=1 Tax=Aeromicrobium marinum DSM 15272 TaxID=585531 RepID=E2SCX7_9ACTN|nr:hypothetical protein [Aeromicrobium marinum]EFQ83080.1 hypothetical protein HMPREF0063_12289 [Aeromicrobium marinum DSM 15272]